jgi:tetratricopeptide (TPR) repeat protein
MRTRMNVKPLIYLVIAVVLLGAGIYVLHEFRVKRSAGSLLKRAIQAEARGDGREAVAYLGRYLVFRPDQPDALARYGLLLEDQAQTPRDHFQALMALEQALVRAPGRDDVRRKAVHAAIGVGRFSDAQSHLNILLSKMSQDDKSAPAVGELELLQARCEAGKGNYAKAGDSLRDVIKHMPELLEGYVRLAGLLRGPLKEPKQADQVMDAMIAANPRSFRAYLERWTYRKELNLPGAASDVSRARELAPEDAEVLLAAGLSARDQGNLKEATAMLERGVALFPKDERMYRLLSVVMLQAGRPEEAEDLLKKGLEAVPEPSQGALLLAMADELIQTGKLDQASQVLTRLREKRVPAEQFGLLEALLHVGRKEWSQAIAVLERTRMATAPRYDKATNDAYARLNLLISTCYENLGVPEMQLAACRRALEADSELLPARMGSAAALAALGRSEEALHEYQAIAAKVPAARISVARLLYLKTVAAPPERRQWPAVDHALSEAVLAAPESVAVTVLSAQVLAAQGQLERARTLLEEASAKQPKEAAIWTVRIELALYQGSPESVLPLLDEAGRHLGDRVELRLARAGWWVRRGGDEARQGLAKLKENLDQFTPGEQADLLDGLGEAFLQLGDRSEAGRLWQRSVALRRGIEGEEGTLWRDAEASRLIALARSGDPSGLGTAGQRLAEVASRRPTWSRVALLQAQVAELQGEPGRALELYDRAIKLGEPLTNVVRQRVPLLYQLGRIDDAERAIREVAEQIQLSGRLGQVAAELALRKQDPARALELAQQAVGPTSPDYRDHLWLGQMLATAKRNADAETELRRAVKMAPGVPLAWASLIQFLAGTDPKAAEAAVQEAEGKLPGDEAALVRAQFDEAIGRKDQAEKIYQAALEARPEDVRILERLAYFYARTGSFGQAEVYLRKIIDPRLKAPANTVVQARRALVLGLIAGVNYQRFREALTLVEENLKVSGGALEDQRTKALVLATHPSQRRDALRLFEELSKRHPPTSDEQFLLAQLYTADNNWTDARNLFQSLLARNENNTFYLSCYIDNLLRHGEIDPARLLLDRLEQREPGTFRTVELKARLLEARGQRAEAVAVLTSYAQTKDAPLGLIAVSLDALGEAAAAETMYRTFVAQSHQPESALAFAAFLGRQGQIEKALDLCTGAWQTCPPETVGLTCLAVLGSARVEDKHYARVDQEFQTAIQKHPTSKGLQRHLALLQTYQGRNRDAEEIYRRLLALDPRDVVALNNLAWLLAVRLGQAEEALSLIQRAIEIAGPTAELLDTRALVYLASNQSDRAIKDLEDVIAQTPAASYYFHLAQAYQVAKNRGSAVKAIREAQNLGGKVDLLEQDAYKALLAGLTLK